MKDRRLDLSEKERTEKAAKANNNKDSLAYLKQEYVLDAYGDLDFLDVQECSFSLEDSTDLYPELKKIK